MQYDSVTGIVKPVSRLVQGCVMLNSENKLAGWHLLDAVLALGCTTFDTAHIYGGGEVDRVFGEWMQDRGIRDEVVVIGKGAHHNADRKRVTPWDITADLYDSLARLKTDYIDLYLLHRDDPAVPVGAIVDTLHEHREAGRIHAYGGSNWHADRIAEANAYAKAQGLAPFVASSPQFSLAVQVQPTWEGCISITGPENASQRAWYAADKMPLFCWSSLAGGWFSGRLTRANQAEHAEAPYMFSYGSEDNFVRLERAEEMAQEKGVQIAQIALAWVMNQPALQVFPLVAAYTETEFAQCVAAMDLRLSPEECAWLNLEDKA